MKVFVKIVIVLMIVSLVGFAIWFILDKTNGGTSDFEMFSVSLNGEKIESKEYDFYVERGETYTFDMSYTFNFNSEDVKEFNVSIVPNYNVGVLDFNVDDRIYTLYGEKDLTKGFNIEKSEKSFTLSIPEDFSVKTVLDGIYAGKTVKVPESYLEESKQFYTIIISSHDGSYVYKIDFGVNVHVKGVTINPTEIEF